MMGIGASGWPMEILLTFQSDGEEPSELRAYRSPRFLGELFDAGVCPIIVDVCSNRKDLVESNENIGSFGTGRVLHCTCDAGQLGHILRQRSPDLIQTFGHATWLADTWNELSSVRLPMMHCVTASQAIGMGSRVLRCTPKPATPSLHSLAGRRAKFASRHVDGLIGSNCADIGQHIELGFFPRAQFSVVAPPPITVASVQTPKSGGSQSSMPVFGYFDPSGTVESLTFLYDAIAWTGCTDLVRFDICPSSLQNKAEVTLGCVSFVDVSGFEDFIDCIDVLVLPYTNDEVVEILLSALRARKTVIAPDVGCVAELLEFGLFGILFKAGSVYHLAEAITTVTRSWRTRSVEFDGFRSVSSKTNANVVASQFRSAYMRCLSLSRLV
jgi:hypothetical protein